MRAFLICLALTMAAWPLRAAATVADYFLELPGISGDASAPSHTGLLAITSFSWGPSGTATFITPTSGATPGLAAAVASGTLFPIANFYAYADPSQALLYEIALSNTLLTSLQLSAGFDHLSLQFGALTLTCHDFDYCANNGVPGLVPEPATLALFGIAFAALGVARRKLH